MSCCAALTAQLLLSGLREQLPGRPNLQGKLARIFLHAAVQHAAVLSPPRGLAPRWQAADIRQRNRWLLLHEGGQVLSKEPLRHAMDAVLQRDLSLLSQVWLAVEALVAALPASCPSPAAFRAF